MHSVMNGYRGLRYLVELNLDRVLTIGAVATALLASVALGSLIG